MTPGRFSIGRGWTPSLWACLPTGRQDMAEQVARKFLSREGPVLDLVRAIIPLTEGAPAIFKAR